MSITLIDKRDFNLFQPLLYQMATGLVASVRASHLGYALEAATGCSLDRGGRVVVEYDFSIASYPDIRIAGDL